MAIPNASYFSFFFLSWKSYFLSCTHSNSYVSYDMLAVMWVSGDNHTQKLNETLDLWLYHFLSLFYAAGQVESSVW